MGKTLTADAVFKAWSTVVSRKMNLDIQILVRDRSNNSGCEHPKSNFFATKVVYSQPSKGDKEHGKITH